MQYIIISTIDRRNSSRFLLIKSEFFAVLSTAVIFEDFLLFMSSSLNFFGSPLKSYYLRNCFNFKVCFFKSSLAFISFIKSKEFCPISFCFWSTENLSWLSWFAHDCFVRFSGNCGRFFIGSSVYFPVFLMFGSLNFLKFVRIFFIRNKMIINYSVKSSHFNWKF